MQRVHAHARVLEREEVDAFHGRGLGGGVGGQAGQLGRGVRVARGDVDEDWGGRERGLEGEVLCREEGAEEVGGDGGLEGGEVEGGDWAELGGCVAGVGDADVDWADGVGDGGEGGTDGGWVGDVCWECVEFGFRILC